MTQPNLDFNFPPRSAGREGRYTLDEYFELLDQLWRDAEQPS